MRITGGYHPDTRCLRASCTVPTTTSLSKTLYIYTGALVLVVGLAVVELSCDIYDTCSKMPHSNILLTARYSRIRGVHGRFSNTHGNRGRNQRYTLTDNRYEWESSYTLCQYTHRVHQRSYCTLEDSYITRAHRLYPRHVAANRGEILKAVRRNQHDVLDAHPANRLVASQHLVVNKLRVAYRSKQMKVEIYAWLDRLRRITSITTNLRSGRASKRTTTMPTSRGSRSRRYL